MKKYLLILAVFLAVSSTGTAETVFNDADAFVISKAVKLGRGISSGAGASVTLGGGGHVVIDTGCSASSECDTGQKCSAKKCVNCSDGEKCDTCPANYVGDGKGGCRLQCVNGQTDCALCAKGEIYDGSKCSLQCEKGQADCELCARGQVYDGSKCRLPCDGVTCPTGTSCKNGTTSACCVPDPKECTVANCASCNTVTGKCEACADGYFGLFMVGDESINSCVKLTIKCSTGQYNDGNNNCLACANGSKCNTCPSETPYWCSDSSGCSASASCNSCSSDSDCTVSGGYACVSGKCTKKCNSSSLPYWCSNTSSCAESAGSCLTGGLVADCYTPTREEICNCSNDKNLKAELQKTFLCAEAVKTEDTCDCSSSLLR